MPLSGIRLLFETLVQCTRLLCKCEVGAKGSQVCNFFAQTILNRSLAPVD